MRSAQQHNLKNIDVSIPRYKFVVLAGVNGSGKNSPVAETLHPALARDLNRAQTRPGPYMLRASRAWSI